MKAVIVEVRCNWSYAVDDLSRFELFQSHLHRDISRAIVVLASQPGPLMGLGGHSELAAEGEGWGNKNVSPFGGAWLDIYSWNTCSTSK